MDYKKHNNICLLRIPEKKKKRVSMVLRTYFKTMTENFPNLVKEKDTEVQGAQRVPDKLDPESPTLRHIIIKMTRLKHKERILKATREKQVVTYKGTPIKTVISLLLRNI